MPGLSSKSRASKTSTQQLEREVRAGQAVVAKKLLGMNLAEGRESQTSLVEMAGLREMPGVLAPSRARERGKSGGAGELKRVDEEKVREGHAPHLLPAREDPAAAAASPQKAPNPFGSGTTHLQIPTTTQHEDDDESSGGWSTGGDSGTDDSE